MAQSQLQGGCAEFRKSLRLNRRGFLKAGGLGLTGLTLSDLLQHEAQAGPTAKKENSVIILWMRGGPSQHETWDPKPNAPTEFRGDFGAIKTSVPGIEIVDLMPRCAKIMEKWSIVRSLHHTNAGHSAGDQILFTGHKPGPDPTINVHPSCGSIVSETIGTLNPRTSSLRDDSPAGSGDRLVLSWCGFTSLLKPWPTLPMMVLFNCKIFRWWKASTRLVLASVKIY